MTRNAQDTTNSLDSILVVCDFSGNIDKTERHIQPLADAVETTMVCITANEAVDQISYKTVPSFGIRPVGLVLMFFLALVEAKRNDYDAVVSFCLIPHGCFGLAVGRLYGLPVHLGLIGMDLDVHAQSKYGKPVRWLIRQFDSVSVPGTVYKQQLEQLGVPPHKTTILANPIDTDRYRPEPDTSHEYDFIWIGRFGPEKNPLLFVEALATLAENGETFKAVMAGDGPLRSTVQTALRENGLDEMVELPGWIDEPVQYYHRSQAFVLTSKRDALPLTLIEAMATGCIPVVSPLGNIPDVANHEHNAIVLPTMAPESLAAALQRLQTDNELCGRLATNAPEVRSRYSYEAATTDWKTILNVLDQPSDYNSTDARATD